ncbi:hypothetical protein V8E54_004494 [Elaphomyces granulatus]
MKDRKECGVHCSDYYCAPTNWNGQISSFYRKELAGLLEYPESRESRRKRKDSLYKHDFQTFQSAYTPMRMSGGYYLSGVLVTKWALWLSFLVCPPDLFDGPFQRSNRKAHLIIPVGDKNDN